MTTIVSAAPFDSEPPASSTGSVSLGGRVAPDVRVGRVVGVADAPATLPVGDAEGAGVTGAGLGCPGVAPGADGGGGLALPGARGVATAAVGDGAVPDVEGPTADGDGPTAVVSFVRPGAGEAGPSGSPNAPTASANVASARFRIPRAMTRRARWDVVTTIRNP